MKNLLVSSAILGSVLLFFVLVITYRENSSTTPDTTSSAAATEAVTPTPTPTNATTAPAAQPTNKPTTNSSPAPASKPTSNSSATTYVASVCTKTVIPKTMVRQGASWLAANTTQISFTGSDGYKQTCTAGTYSSASEYTSPPVNGTILVSTKPTSEEINSCVSYNRNTPGTAWYSMTEEVWAYRQNDLYNICATPSTKYMD